MIDHEQKQKKQIYRCDDIDIDTTTHVLLGRSQDTCQFLGFLNGFISWAKSESDNHALWDCP